MNYTEQQLTAAVVSEGLRPVLAGPESGASPVLLSLIQRCWDADPQNRPSFSDIVSELGAMLEYAERADKKEDTSANSVISHVGTASIQTFQEPINWFSQGQDFSETVHLSSENALSSWLSSNDTGVYLPVLSWGSFSTLGRREAMEDTHVMMPNFGNEKNIHLFGIFDGHRGI